MNDREYTRRKLKELVKHDPVAAARIAVNGVRKAWHDGTPEERAEIEAVWSKLLIDLALDDPRLAETLGVPREFAEKHARPLPREDYEEEPK